MQVAIDARELARPPDGTRVHLTEVIVALAGTGAVTLRAIVPHGLDAAIRERLAAADGLELLTPEAAAQRPPADVVHRPHQVSAPADLAVLARLGRRLVLTQQDLIGFRQPAYFPSEASWQGYRALTRRALAASDHVVFFSEHVRGDALAEGLLEPTRGSVVPIGVDHAGRGGPSARARQREPAGAGALADTGTTAGAETIVCLGTDLVHKNRVFALQIAAELRARGWRGRLVLAGPHVRHGSSREAERAEIAAHPGLAAAVLDLGALSPGELEWLLARTRLVLYPTREEGFGLVPHEAAAHGIPCLWAPGGALGEHLDDALAGIVPGDAAASADRALVLLRDEAERRRLLDGVRAFGAALRWSCSGEALAALYARCLAEPPAPGATLERTAGLMGDELSEDALRLLGPGGAIPRDLERPLLALATRPRLARPVFAALRAAYRLRGDPGDRGDRGDRGEPGRRGEPG